MTLLDASWRYTTVKYGMTYSEAMEEEVEVKCPDCSSRRIDDDSVRGERSCEDCGLVIAENMIDPGQDWNTFVGKEETIRGGPPATVMVHDKGLSTDIHWANKDYAGRSIAGKNRSQFYRMRKWQRRARVSGSFDRNMEAALVEIGRLASKMGMGKLVKEETAVIYRKALEKDMVRGRSIDTVVAASMYLANQKLRTARSLDDFQRHSDVSRKSITRAHKVIKAALGVRIPVSEPSEYVGRYAGLLDLPPEINASALRLLDRAGELELTHGKSPTGLAADALYIAARQGDRHRTQRDIADISGVTEVTIRNRYKEMVSGMGLELD
jgi:transcription initiation factor TFIIB